jgi:phosphatidylserine/phosphatidylglycerophosphate/cardiolipin synthase-like enzyme
MRFSLRCFAPLLLLVLQTSLVFAETEVLFSSDQSIQGTLLNEMESTNSTIDLAIREITSKPLAQALLKAKERGIAIRIITDSKQAKRRSSKITYLIQEGVPVKILRGKDHGVMNYRFAILDGKKVMTGSFDWSEASEKRNYENLLILWESDTVASYQKEFERLWREKRVVH